MKYVYHYCANRILANGDTIVIDGIIEAEKIDSYFKFIVIRQIIAGQMNVDNFEEVRITSFTFLHTKED